MRVGTFSMYHDFDVNQQKGMRGLNNVNNQISSGTKIQYGYQDTSVFIDTLRLDKETYTLAQNTKSADSAKNFAATSDSTLSSMVTALTEFKTKLINASNETHSTSSRKAIATDLKALREHMMTLANTAIDGQYIFSGSAFNQKPISPDGTYNGNGESVKALVSAGVQLPFNVDGKGLFLGSDSDYSRSISTNVPKKNQTLLHETPPTDRYITTDDTIADMTGNSGDGKRTYFYVSGALSDGTSFKQRVDMDTTAKVSDLLDKIKDIYKGNVDVTLNNYGQIEIKDLNEGSSKLQFHMVATDNSEALTKATAGYAAGSTSITVNSAVGIAAGDVLNIEGLGRVQVSSVAGTTVNFLPPLSASAEFGVSEVNVKKVNGASTTTTAVAAAGATTVNLTAIPAGLVAGNDIVIGGETYTVSSIAGLNVTLTSGLKAAVGVGDLASAIVPTTDVSTLSASGQTVTEFIKSGMGPLNVGGAIEAWNDRLDHSSFNFNFELRNRETQKFSLSQELLSTATGAVPASIDLNGTNYAFALGAASTVGDLVNSVQTALNAQFGASKFTASLVDGKIKVKDLTIDEEYSSTQSSSLVTMTLNTPANTFASINGVESDKAYFEKNGSKLTSNVSQIVRTTNEYVKPTDTVLSASGMSTLAGEQIIMQMTTIAGTAQTVQIDLGAAASTFSLDNGTTNYTIFNAASPQVTTAANNLTYQQLTDIMSMVVSGTLPATVATAADYNSAVKAAQTQAEVSLDNNGRIVVQDKTNAVTKASLSMYDSTTNAGFTSTLTYNTSSVTLNSNNALTMDDPFISLFDQLQMAIEAVESDKTRASDDGVDSRNIGIQNSILAIDHVFDHVVREHTQIGAVSSAFTTSSERTTTLGIHLKTVRSEVMDTDVASAYLELNQRSLNYQALLSSVSKINGLSLVNYM